MPLLRINGVRLCSAKLRRTPGAGPKRKGWTQDLQLRCVMECCYAKLQFLAVCSVDLIVDPVSLASASMSVRCHLITQLSAFSIHVWCSGPVIVYKRSCFPPSFSLLHHSTLKEDINHIHVHTLSYHNPNIQPPSSSRLNFGQQSCRFLPFSPLSLLRPLLWLPVRTGHTSKGVTVAVDALVLRDAPNTLTKWYVHLSIL